MPCLEACVAGLEIPVHVDAAAEEFDFAAVSHPGDLSQACSSGGCIKSKLADGLAVHQQAPAQARITSVEDCYALPLHVLLILYDRLDPANDHEIQGLIVPLQAERVRTFQ